MDNVRTLQGDLLARDLRFAIVASRFNDYIVDSLVRGAIDTLLRHGANEKQIELIRVPGAFDLPLVVRRVALSKRCDAVIALGAVIRGETRHFEIVANESASGLMQVQLDSGIPIANGILTADTEEQAQERAKKKGRDCAEVAVEMANLAAQVAKSHK